MYSILLYKNRETRDDRKIIITFKKNNENNSNKKSSYLSWNKSSLVSHCKTQCYLYNEIFLVGNEEVMTMNVCLYFIIILSSLKNFSGIYYEWICLVFYDWKMSWILLLYYLIMFMRWINEDLNISLYKLMVTASSKKKEKTCHLADNTIVVCFLTQTGGNRGLQF